MKWWSSILCLAILPVAAQVFAQNPGSPADPSCQYTRRIDWSDPCASMLYYAGSAHPNREVSEAKAVELKRFTDTHEMLPSVAPEASAPQLAQSSTKGAVYDAMGLLKAKKSAAAAPAVIPHVWQTAVNNATWISGPYKLCNNLWGSGKGCSMWADSYVRWAAIPNYPLDEMHVMAYPECWRGYHYAEQSAPKSGFSIKLSEIRKLKARWAMTEPMRGRHWALWDIYFAKEKSGWKGKGWCNVMLFQNWVDPTHWIPNGLVNGSQVSLGYQDAGDVKLKCAKTSAGWIDGPVITAIPDAPMPDAIFDLKELFLNLAKTGVIDYDWYLIGIEVGWEIHQGTEPLVTDYFVIDLNEENRLDKPRSPIGSVK